MELSGPKIKKALVFSQKKLFLLFQELELYSPMIKKFPEGTFRAKKIKKPTQKKFLILREIELSSSKLKELYTFSKKVFLTFLQPFTKYLRLTLDSM